MYRAAVALPLPACGPTGRSQRSRRQRVARYPNDSLTSTIGNAPQAALRERPAEHGNRPLRDGLDQPPAIQRRQERLDRDAGFAFGDAELLRQRRCDFCSAASGRRSARRRIAPSGSNSNDLVAPFGKRSSRGCPPRSCRQWHDQPPAAVGGGRDRLGKPAAGQRHVAVVAHRPGRQTHPASRADGLGDGKQQRTIVRL